MKKNLIILAIIILMLVFYSCKPLYVPIRGGIKKSFTKCYTGELINVEDKINLSGYYIARESLDNVEVFSLLFFKDGSVAQNVHGITLNDKEWLENYTSWGVYTINGDIINIQMIMHNFNTSSCLETNYRIINKNELWKINTIDLETKTVWSNDSTKKKYLKPLYFRRLKNKPDSICWQKRKKWFWCDEEKYETYMKNNNNK